MSYVVEDGVPFPPPVGNRGNRRTNTGSLCESIRALRVGQSMLVEDRTVGAVHAASRMAELQSHGSEYTVRKVRGGTRIWRLQ